MEDYLKQKLFLALIVFGVIAMASPVLAVGISVGYPSPIPLLAGENLYYGASTGSLGNLILLQVNSATKFSVDPTGAISIYGDIKPGGVSCANNQILQKNSTGTNWVCATLPVVTGDNLGNHTATQILSMGNFKISDLAAPTAGTDATTKAYVDAKPGDNLGNHTATQILGMGGFKITNLATPTLPADAATMAYVDAKPGDNLGNHIATTDLNMSTIYRITNLAAPGALTDATNKTYVDTAVATSGWVDDGTAVRLIAATDNVGIGTANPVRKLSILDSSNGPLISLSGLTSNYRGLSLRQSSNDAENWFIGADNSNNFVVRRNDSIYDLTIDSSGNVGVGTITPSSALHINATDGNTTFTGNTPGQVTISNNNGNNYFSSLDFKGNQIYPIARVGMLQTGGGSYLRFGTSNNYATGITNAAMTIDYSGNVGVGTMWPANKLDVVGGSLGIDLQTKTCNNMPTNVTNGCTCSTFGSDYVVLNGGPNCQGVSKQTGSSYPGSDKVTWYASCFSGIFMDIQITCARIRDNTAGN